MTTAERLVRNACDAKRSELVAARSAQVKTINRTVPLTQAPKRVQDAVEELLKLQPRIAELKTRITEAGFEPPYGDSCSDKNPKRTIQIEYKGHERRLDAIRARYEEDLTTVMRLKQAASIATLGKTNLEARPVLVRLAADLAAL